jgi:hypothetical protein
MRDLDQALRDEAASIDVEEHRRSFCAVSRTLPGSSRLSLLSRLLLLERS